jgi:hypothetical protein
MAHFAQLNDNNVVVRVIVVDNKDTTDATGVEKEYIGKAHCEKIYGGRWVQTSYNGNIRKRYAGIGMVYLEEHDHFAPPKPSATATYDPELGEWVKPE